MQADRWAMEVQLQRLDREALLADRLAAAERVHRETDAEVAAAREKRLAFMMSRVDAVRAGATAERERLRIQAATLAAFEAREAQRHATEPRQTSEIPEDESAAQLPLAAVG